MRTSASIARRQVLLLHPCCVRVPLMRAGAVELLDLPFDSLAIPQMYVQAGATMVLRPVVACAAAADCSQCQSNAQASNFNCSWCAALQICSDGIDRRHNEWFLAGCQAHSVCLALLVVQLTCPRSRRARMCHRSPRVCAGCR